TFFSPGSTSFIPFTTDNYKFFKTTTFVQGQSVRGRDLVLLDEPVAILDIRRDEHGRVFNLDHPSETKYYQHVVYFHSS
nr:hypothetical protein [Candidatus Sigynarchaeota archaeon]